LLINVRIYFPLCSTCKIEAAPEIVHR
jgi:hypothetical protein